MHTCLGENGSAIEIRTPRMRRRILFRHRPVRTFEGEWPRHGSRAASTINHLRRAVLFPSRSIRRMRALGCVGSVFVGQAVRAVSEVRPV